MRGILHHEDFGWAAAARFGGGGGGTSTTVQKSDPWYGQQPYLTDVFSRAQGLMESQPPQYYPSGTYQPLLPSQQQALQSAYDIGMTGGTAPLKAASAANVATQDPSYTGMTGSTFGAVNPLIQSIGSGSQLAATQPAFGQGQRYLSDTIGGGYLAPTLGTYGQGQRLLSNEIGGAYLDPSRNPGFQSMVDTTLAKVVPSITAGFTGAGRADSGLASRAVAQGATDAVGNLAYQNYQAERQAQDAAQRQAAQQYQTERGLQAGAAGQAAQNQATGLGATETAQALASNNLLTQQGNQIKAQELAPSLDIATMNDLQAALSAGGVSQSDIQNLINSDIQRWNYDQALPWNTLGMYNSLIQGNYGGTQTLTQPYYSNQAANIMGGIGAAASVAASVAAII